MFEYDIARDLQRSIAHFVWLCSLVSIVQLPGRFTGI
jgi:hypothetical protein